jgi:hypothetical protein
MLTRPALDTDHRHPLRQALAQLLQSAEEVVRTVDLVYFAGLGVAKHNRRPIDPIRHRRILAHQRLGVVLGLEIRMVEVLRLVEHVLAEDAGIQAGNGN